jgi:hypothetical protein
MREEPVSGEEAWSRVTGFMAGMLLAGIPLAALSWWLGWFG